MYNNPPQNYPTPNGGFPQMPPNAMPGTMPMGMHQFYVVNPQQQQNNGNNFTVPPNFNGAPPPPTMLHHHPNMMFGQTGVPMFTQPPPPPSGQPMFVTPNLQQQALPPNSQNVHIRQAPFYQPMHQQPPPQQQQFGQSPISSQMPPTLQQQPPVQLAGGGRPQIPAQYYTNPSIMSRQPPLPHQAQYVAAPMSHLVRSQSQNQFSPPIYDPQYQQHTQMETRSVSSYPNAAAIEFMPQQHQQIHMDEEQFRNMHLTGHEEQMLREQHQQQSQSVSTGVSEEPAMFNHQERHQSQQSESDFSAVNEEANNKQMQKQPPMENTFDDQHKNQFVAADTENRLVAAEELLQVPEVSSNAITPDNSNPPFQDAKQTPPRSQPAESVDSWRNSSTKLQKIHEENGQQAAVGGEADNRVMHSHPPRDGPKICYYCKSNGESPEVYNSHHTTDRLNSIVCPKLLTQKGCSRCAAASQAEDSAEPVHLELDCTFVASPQTEDFHQFAIKFSERIGHHRNSGGGGQHYHQNNNNSNQSHYRQQQPRHPQPQGWGGGGNKRGGGYEHQHGSRSTTGQHHHHQQKYNG